VRPQVEPLEARVVLSPLFLTPESLKSGHHPSAVAVADVNGDGIPDVIITNELINGAATVLLGKGNGTFHSPMSFAAGKYPNAVVVADVNGDGHPDIIVGNFSYANVSVLLGNGNGTFQAPLNLTTNVGGQSVALADINGDGHLDIVAVGNSSSINSVNVLLGNGNGTFQSLKQFDGGGSASSVAVADVNGDGRADLVVSDAAGFSPGPVTVLLGQGSTPAPPPAGGRSSTAAAGTASASQAQRLALQSAALALAGSEPGLHALRAPTSLLREAEGFAEHG
jgi:hypothetical protein